MFFTDHPIMEQDSFRAFSEQPLKDTINATNVVYTVHWSRDDIRSIALTIFIQRTRGSI